MYYLAKFSENDVRQFSHGARHFRADLIKRPISADFNSENSHARRHAPKSLYKLQGVA
jgi:hypothetical protein